MQTRSSKKDLVKSKIQFLESADEGGTATYHASQAGADETKEHDGQFQKCEVCIYNGRTRRHWDLDQQGFCLTTHSTEVTDFQSDQQVQEILYAEAKKVLLQHIRGATRIEIFDHTRRASTAKLRKELKCRETAEIVHNDYTGKSATKRLYDMLPSEADILIKQRFAIVNLWRSTAGTIQSCPLAFCDSTSLNRQRDLISVKRVAQDRIGELQMALYSPDHQWYYFPNMTMDEALIFKTYDSSPKVNQFTLHTALQDIGDAKVPRQSIEIRAFVFFE